MQLNSADVALGDAETLEAVNEAFVLQGSLAILNPITYSDDLLATLETFTTHHLFQDTLQCNPAESFKWRFLSEVYRLLGLQYDYSLNAQDNSLLKAAVIQRCLSLQASLGFNGTRNVPPSLSSQVAQCILDLRFIAYALMMAKKSRTEGKPRSWTWTKKVADRMTDFVQLLVGMVSWFMTLIAFIIDETISIAKAFQDQERNINNLDIDQVNQQSNFIFVLPVTI